MTEQEAIQASIEHWERMIKWAEGRKSKAHPSMDKMYNEIGEHWEGDYCEICMRSIGCKTCPLFKKYGHCVVFEDEQADNNYSKVVKAKTWHDWLKEAYIMLNQLKSLKEA